MMPIYFNLRAPLPALCDLKLELLCLCTFTRESWHPVVIYKWLHSRVILSIIHIVMFLFSGSKKSVALKCIVKALKSVREELNITPTADESMTSQTLTTDHGGLFSVNETITTAKLADQLVRNDGVYLNLLDEIEGLFQSLEGKSRDNLVDLGGFRSTGQRPISVPVTE